MRHFITSLSIAAMLMIPGTAGAQSQQINRYELDINDFSEVKVTDGLNVDYKWSADSAGMAVFTTTPDLASVLMLSNRKGKLEMQISTEGIDYINLPTITIYSSYLTAIENSGDSTVRVLSVAPGPQFYARVIGNGRISARGVNAGQVKAKILTGNGQIVILGKCEDARLSITGTGSIQADELFSKEARCSIIGTGTIGCAASDFLSVSGTGTGKVYYRGTPATLKTHIGGIKALPLE